MNAVRVGVELARARRAAGLSQREVGARMGTTQSAISRLEAGRIDPSVEVIERFALAVGHPIKLTFGDEGRPSRRQLRARVRSVLGDYEFDPWAREPTSVEQQTLEADGLSRERFQRIGLDDLYLDRLRQATMNEGSQTAIEFQSALAVAAARYDDLDWRYIRSRIATISKTERSVGESMRRINSRITRRVRRSMG